MLTSVRVYVEAESRPMGHVRGVLRGVHVSRFLDESRLWLRQARRVVARDFIGLCDERRGVLGTKHVVGDRRLLNKGYYGQLSALHLMHKSTGRKWLRSLALDY